MRVSARYVLSLGQNEGFMSTRILGGCSVKPGGLFAVYWGNGRGVRAGHGKSWQTISPEGSRFFCGEPNFPSVMIYDGGFAMRLRWGWAILEVWEVEAGGDFWGHASVARRAGMHCWGAVDLRSVLGGLRLPIAA